MRITEVTTPAQAEAFIRLPELLYREDPNFLQPLDKDIRAVFDPRENKFFRHGQCTRFLLYDDAGKVIGRIAAFINDRLARKEAQPTGGCGFFECMDDQAAANLLFDAAREWLQARGMEAMDGPVNFGERDAWWGLIVEGFDPPPYRMNYNPPYYRRLFESYGFQAYFQQWCYSLKVVNRLQEKFYTRHALLSTDPDYRAEHLRKSQLDKYAEDFRIIYNKAWVKYGAGKDLEPKQVKGFFRKMKPIIDEKVIWFVYYKNEPVAMWVNLPDINQLFGRFKGRFGMLEKLRFMWLLKRRKTKKFIGLVFGIVPEHQGKGVDAFMIVEGAKVIQGRNLYEDFEMQWIGDFNPKMVAIAESLGTYRSRVLITYRYLFDRNKPFQRHPFI